jgi:hypothetical protein
MPLAPQIDAPQTLTGLFPPDSSEDDDDDDDRNAVTYEIQPVELAGIALQIRQFDYHSHNANRVWPGTFQLADYLLARGPDNRYKFQLGRVLELGTATGLLAIRLALASTNITMDQYSSSPPKDSVIGIGHCCTSVVTTDVQDEHGEVAFNLRFNYQLNGIGVSLDSEKELVTVRRRIPPHVPHTWGSGWRTSVEQSGVLLETTGCDEGYDFDHFDTIIGSDILLYVSAYSGLVETLTELIPSESPCRFIMSWNRRMKESAEFFERMDRAGFESSHEGKCIYIFKRR